MHDAASVLIDGPWRHRLVSANGARFHVAELGDGPMVLLIHGFPQFWYAWRHQMAAIADAGWRAVAMDLRGYGASDKPPRGYDTYTSTADAASVIRSLGEDDAIVVGHGLGGFVAWSMPSLQPGVTRAIGSLAMPHPRVIRRASFADRRQRHASRYLLDLQRPFGPEREMTRDHAYVFDSNFAAFATTRFGPDDNDLIVRNSSFNELVADGGRGNNTFDDQGGNTFGKRTLKRFEV